MFHCQSNHALTWVRLPLSRILDVDLAAKMEVPQSATAVDRNRTIENGVISLLSTEFFSLNFFELGRSDILFACTCSAYFSNPTTQCMYLREGTEPGSESTLGENGKGGEGLRMLVR